MRGRHEYIDRLRQLTEIKDIMASMKNVAFMETRKLARFIAFQERVVSGIEAAAADFYGFVASPEPQPPPQRSCFVLFGSERGFCADFNERILAAFDLAARETPHGPVLAVAVGGKLSSRMEGDPRLAGHIPGPSAAEEVDDTLIRLVDCLGRLETTATASRVTAIYLTEELRVQPLLPPFQHLLKPPGGHAYPPLLYLEPDTFASELIDHYLFAVLHQIIYASLAAENRRRVQHLQGAGEHIDERIEQLTRRIHSLRQEEITEEIEVILITAESFAP